MVQAQKKYSTTEKAALAVRCQLYGGKCYILFYDSVSCLQQMIGKQFDI